MEEQEKSPEHDASDDSVSPKSTSADLDEELLEYAKEFSDSTDLDEHLSNHADDGQHQCQGCKKTFSDKNGLSTGMALEFARREDTICPTGGHDLPDRGTS
ncbi:hypothetical protein AVEN_21858-1, partial [Araneus ventricosus]